MKALRVTVYGRVQGVWFRVSTREQAQRLGVQGWVRNTPEGSVEIRMQGNPQAVESLIDWCRHGPPGARVDRVDLDEVETEPGTAGFHILY